MDSSTPVSVASIARIIKTPNVQEQILGLVRLGVKGKGRKGDSYLRDFKEYVLNDVLCRGLSNLVCASTLSICNDTGTLIRLLRHIFPVWIRIVCTAVPSVLNSSGTGNFQEDGSKERVWRLLRDSKGEAQRVLKNMVSLKSEALGRNDGGDGDDNPGQITLTPNVPGILGPPGHFGITTKPWLASKATSSKSKFPVTTPLGQTTTSKNLAIFVISIFLCQVNSTKKETDNALSSLGGDLVGNKRKRVRVTQKRGVVSDMDAEDGKGNGGKGGSRRGVGDDCLGKTILLERVLSNFVMIYSHYYTPLLPQSSGGEKGNDEDSELIDSSATKQRALERLEEEAISLLGSVSYGSNNQGVVFGPEGLLSLAINKKYATFVKSSSGIVTFAAAGSNTDSMLVKGLKRKGQKGGSSAKKSGSIQITSGGAAPIVDIINGVKIKGFVSREVAVRLGSEHDIDVLGYVM